MKTKIIILYGLNLIDLALTFIGLNKGLGEANFLYNIVGNNFILFGLLKTILITIFTFMFGYNFKTENINNTFYYTFLVAYIITIINNIILIIK